MMDIGDRILGGKYVLKAFLGDGSFGEVFGGIFRSPVAVEVLTGQRVAVKVVSLREL